ncbi:MAG: hypothetical protein ABH875_01005 [Candidatus Omnitrophota bacterium]
MAGIAIDTDHIFDYWMSYGLRRFSLKRFYTCSYRVRYERLTLIFHSYELIILFWLAIWIFSLSDIWKAVAIGFTQHLLLDHLRNLFVGKMRGWGYFLTYRIMNRFATDRLVKPR